MRYRRQFQREARHQAAHTDDWLMTYADMITLLLCFFAIFLSVSLPKKDGSQKPEVAQAVQTQTEYAAVPQPEIPTNILAVQGLDRAEQDDSDQPAASPAPVAGELPSARRSATALDDASGKHDQVSMPATAAIVQTEEAVVLDRPRATLPEIVDRVKAQTPQNAAQIERQGDRITTIEISSAAFFDSGSAVLRRDGKAILQGVAANLRAETFKGYRITVEGHTDDTPIDTAQFPSNWELSSARAAAVVRFFLEQGLPSQKLRAAGYADTFPKAPNRDAAGRAIPANQAQNRRVVIKLEKIDKDNAAAP